MAPPPYLVDVPFGHRFDGEKVVLTGKSWPSWLASGICATKG